MNFSTMTDYIRTPEDDANDAAEAAWKQRRNADSLRALQSRLEREARQCAMNHLTATEPAHQLSRDMTEEPEELCESCEANAADDLHTCPYMRAKFCSDPNGLSERQCNCCDKCHEDCGWRS